ncbi:hypothetical protein [Acidithiobacillus ferriphilus]|uniref:hypothetical protein n=1 Tax=Acidithiobacillus ferriphilus TaxID=1689834 RepID=UPI00232B19AF|nr:hypothetical protein [Acidithiobacillus ferriphilus]WCE92690.1 hypothetical protein PJU76_06890 [Acidithiobacillus ferriphilus]
MIPSFSSTAEIESLSIALMWAVFIGAFAALLVYDALGSILSMLIRLVDRLSARRHLHD